MKLLVLLVCLSPIIHASAEPGIPWYARIEHAEVVIGIDGLKQGKYHFDRIGTGLICYIIDARSGSMVPCIITVKHLIFEPEEGYLPFQIRVRFGMDKFKSPAVPAGLDVSLATLDANQLWFCPNDLSVDLACIPLLPREADAAGLNSAAKDALFISSFPDSLKVYPGEKIILPERQLKCKYSRGSIIPDARNSSVTGSFPVKDSSPEEGGNIVMVRRSPEPQQMPLAGMVSCSWIPEIKGNNINGMVTDSLYMIHTWSGYSKVIPVLQIHMLLKKAELMVDRFMELK